MALLLVGVVLMHEDRALDIVRPEKAIERRVRERHRTASAQRLRHACKRTNCDCALVVASAGLDVDAGSDVLRVLAAAPSCAETSALDGMRAEALVRSGAVEAGQVLANGVLSQHANDAHALTALALASYGAKAPDTASRAEAAVRAGRGDAAEFLLGLARFAQDDFDGAKRAFVEALGPEPTDVDALYNLGLVAQHQKHYGEARTRYLTVLRIDPRHKLARFNLGVLAHSIGATAEANHDLDKLASVAPGDPLVTQLKNILASAPTEPPVQVLSLGAPAADSGTSP